jgi:hypothetical protein
MLQPVSEGGTRGGTLSGACPCVVSCSRFSCIRNSVLVGGCLSAFASHSHVRLFGICTFIVCRTGLVSAPHEACVADTACVFACVFDIGSLVLCFFTVECVLAELTRIEVTQALTLCEDMKDHLDHEKSVTLSQKLAMQARTFICTASSLRRLTCVFCYVWVWVGGARGKGK